jgi:hypothetical protein
MRVDVRSLVLFSVWASWDNQQHRPVTSSSSLLVVQSLRCWRNIRRSWTIREYTTVWFTRQITPPHLHDRDYMQHEFHAQADCYSTRMPFSFVFTILAGHMDTRPRHSREMASRWNIQPLLDVLEPIKSAFVSSHNLPRLCEAHRTMHINNDACSITSTSWASMNTH